MTDKDTRGSTDQRPILKWATTPPGTLITGIKGPTEEGWFGQLTTITTAAGEIVVPVPAALRERLEAVPEGERIELIYIGLRKKKSTTSERSYHQFTLRVAVEPQARRPERRPVR